FPAVDVEPSVKMPKFDDRPGGQSVFQVQMWQTWADPLAHANHPAYVDWCDEATSRRMVEAGIDPSLLRPVAEQVTFRDSVLPGEQVTVRTERVGVFGQNAVVLKHHLETNRGPAAEATSIRGLAAESGDPLIAAWD
ncbi:MAG: acyl-CoA thioesterase, partial [Myxococcales bacterium]|nr:acyl-CoA thioesterase [Myxococcales bacterium]